jgi:hypothetical protein
VQHWLSALQCQSVEPKDISTACEDPLPVCKGHRATECMLGVLFRAGTVRLWLW